MKKATLYNRNGQALTEVNISDSEIADGVIWGNVVFIWSKEHQHYREAILLPAIIKKSEKK